jgi:hypothetical protein
MKTSDDLGGDRTGGAWGCLPRQDPSVADRTTYAE